MKLTKYKWGVLLFAIVANSACFHNNPAPPVTTVDDPNNQTGTVDLPTFTVEVSGDGVVRENEGSVGFTVTLSHGMADGIGIAYQVRDGSATRQQDFLIFSQDRSATQDVLQIPPNQTTGTFFVYINNDTIYEPAETFSVAIALEGHADTTGKIFPITIISEDALPVVQLYSDQGTFVRVKESAGFIPITINLPISQSSESIVIPLVYKTVPGDSAIPNVDFVAQDSIEIPPATSQDAENQVFTFNLLIKDDAVAEPDESFIIELQDPLDGKATLGGGLAALTITIEDDDVSGQLNDTQITSCANDTLYDTTCPQPDHPLQDGESNLPLNLVRLDSSGAITPLDTQTVCIEDQNTKLIWEVKTALGSATGAKREYNYQYTWFNPLENANGGSSGFEGGINDCSETLDRCNTSQYVEALNTAALCNQTNWRMPKLSELVSLMQFGPIPLGNGNVLLNDSLFTNTQEFYYWTASPVAGFSAQAWAIFMGKTPITSAQSQFVVPRRKELKAHILAVSNSPN